MDYHPLKVSVTAPVDPAMERSRQILFRPFDLNKWIAIGFCAWLAHLGQGGGSFNRHNSGGKHPNSIDFQQAKAYVLDNLTWIVPLAIGIFIFILALVVLFLWLQSRGAFMLLHCIANNRGEVAVPWKRYAREARSLWIFRLALGGIGIALILPIIGAGLWVMSDMFFGHGQFDSGRMPLLIELGLAWICLGLPLAIASYFTNQFVVPIMYLKGGTCVEGWQVLLPLLAANPWRFILYLLFQIVIGIVIAFMVLAFVLCTCCVGGILLVIPFVGSVILLPVTIFMRSYSLVYLAQYGADLDVFGLVERTML